MSLPIQGHRSGGIGSVFFLFLLPEQNQAELLSVIEPLWRIAQLQLTKANLLLEHTPGYTGNTCLGWLETSQKTQMRQMNTQETRLNDQAGNKMTLRKIEAQPRASVSPGRC